MKKISTFAFIMFIFNLAFSQKLKNGDLLFQNLDEGDFCQAIERVTPAYKGIHFSHVGILSRIGGKLQVVEAISTGVVITPLDIFLNRCDRKKIYVGRLKDKSNVIMPDENIIKPYLNKPYDTVFQITNQAIYCSELVYFLYQNNQHQPIFELQPMTFKDPATNEYLPAWVEYFKKMNSPIPEKKPEINPGLLINSPLLNVFRLEKQINYFQ